MYACAAHGNALHSTGGFRTSKACSLPKKRHIKSVELVNDRVLFQFCIKCREFYDLFGS